MRSPRRPWRMSEVQILRAALGPKRRAREVAREVAPRIGRTVEAVDTMIHRLHAATGDVSPFSFRAWAPKEIEALDALIDSSPYLPPGAALRLARSLGRSLEAIRHALCRRRAERGLVKRRNEGAK